MYFFVCQPLLSRTKGANSPLDMNYFYVMAVRRLANFEGDSGPLLYEDAEIWGGAVKETEQYRPYIPHIQDLAKRDTLQDKVCMRNLVLHGCNWKRKTDGSCQ